MFDKCITCERLGQDCVPDFMKLSFAELLEWWKKRQAYLGWSNQILSEKSTVPLGTINRIKAGEEDCRYSTMRCILHALMGGYAVNSLVRRNWTWSLRTSKHWNNKIWN